MKIVGVPRINALGKVGPEKAPEKILTELGLEGEVLEIDNSDISLSEKEIYEKGKSLFNREKVAVIGGDHSITYPLFKGFSEVNKDAFLIVFDAHADCMPAMKEPTHEEFLRAIIENGFDGSRVILVGARKIEDVEKKFLVENGVKVFGCDFDLEAVGDYITEKANGKSVYVSVDIDVLDPAFAPAVNYAEPGGLSARELFYLLNRLFKMKGKKVLDVVEVVPEKDEKYDYRTVKVAAKVVGDFIS